MSIYDGGEQPAAETRTISKGSGKPKLKKKKEIRLVEKNILHA